MFHKTPQQFKHWFGVNKPSWHSTKAKRSKAKMYNGRSHVPLCPACPNGTMQCKSAIILQCYHPHQTAFHAAYLPFWPRPTENKWRICTQNLLFWIHGSDL